MSSNSASSCATFSTAASRSSSTSSVANRDYILGRADPEYQTSALSSGNAKRIHKLPGKFHCSLCPKFYTRAYNLRSHIQTHRDHDRKSQEGFHSGENKFICRGDLQQRGHWGCGRDFVHLGALGQHLRSEAGKKCIKLLVAEELSWNKVLRQGIHATGKLGPFPQEERSGNASFPASLVAQYPGLATLPWSELAQADVGLDEDIEQSGSLTSDPNTSSESSCSTFSSLSSDESNIKESSDWSNYLLSDMLIFSDVTGDNATNNITVLPHGNLEVLNGQIDFGEIHLGHATYIDAASTREHKHSAIGAELEEPDWTRWSTSTDWQAYRKWIARTQPVGLDNTQDLSESHSTPFEAAKVEQPFEQTHSVEVLGSNDSEEDTETINGAENDVPLSHNHYFKHDESAQLSPARSSSSTVGSKLGKASPYSVQSQDSESDSCFEGETEMSFDECESFLSPSPSLFHISDLWAPKQMLIIDILRAFWDIYNKEFPWIISRCIASIAKDFTNGATSGAPSSSSSRSALSTSRSSSTVTSSSISSLSVSKRKFSEDDGDRGPMEPIQGSILMPKDQPIIRYGCPFRKHNPRKYNMHHYQSCALGSFGSIARVKEHLYRRHMAPIQCVRCWLFFKDQENLNIHISATNICERRDGEAAEGITPSTEKRLRSRKKLSGGQTDNDRWRDIYRMLFPGVTDEDIPSPCKSLMPRKSAHY
ncbi:hypothetical protein BKA65DRAFT_198481 [Rhexocercosporidium sp. MPI-PUGE-AT-0058]|nr:hypothetical protein BKA65DRAFT_198481 [Rhexocercosporidium sp. MPI-PUGE-AT-0058]